MEIKVSQNSRGRVNYEKLIKQISNNSKPIIKNRK